MTHAFGLIGHVMINFLLFVVKTEKVLLKYFKKMFSMLTAISKGTEATTIGTSITTSIGTTEISTTLAGK